MLNMKFRNVCKNYFSFSRKQNAQENINNEISRILHKFQTNYEIYVFAKIQKPILAVKSTVGGNR